MSTSIDSFLPFIIPSVMGCPEITAEQAILLAAIDFCKRTFIVQRIQAPMDVTANTQDYAVTLPTDMQLGAVLGVSWQGVWLTVAPPDVVNLDVALRGANIGSALVSVASPMYWFQKTPDVGAVSLYPLPDTTLVGGLLIKSAFYPTQIAATVDDSLFNDWNEEIAHGALYRLLAMRGQQWSGDPAYHKTMFERGINNAKRSKMVGKAASGSRVMPQSFV